MITMEVYKILKYQSPISMYSQYLISNRNYLSHNLNLITPSTAGDFIQKSTLIWNSLRKPLQITDLSSNGILIKNKIKSLLFEIQHRYHAVEWLPTLDFNISKMNIKIPQSLTNALSFYRYNHPLLRLRTAVTLFIFINIPLE